MVKVRRYGLMANSIQRRKHVYSIFFSLTMVKGICCQIRSSSDNWTFSSNRNRNAGAGEL